MPSLHVVFFWGGGETDLELQSCFDAAVSYSQFVVSPFNALTTDFLLIGRSDGGAHPPLAHRGLINEALTFLAWTEVSVCFPERTLMPHDYLKEAGRL